MYNNYNLPKYHSIVTISLRTNGLNRNIKVLMTDSGIFRPLVDYFIENQFKSISWQNNVTYIIGLFIDYMLTCQHKYSSSVKKRIYFLPNFIKLLHYGSINKFGKDELNLYWNTKKIYRVNELENYLFRFLDWYYKNTKNLHESIFKISYKDLTFNEKILYWRHWNNKKYASLLSHLKSTNINVSHCIYIKQKKALFKSDLYDIKYFDNSKIIDLLFKGFKTNKIKEIYDVRNILITMLMHFGGCRISEPFHLFINDVIEDPNEEGKALVKIYHPEDGAIKYYDKYKNKIINTNRKEYLNRVYGINSRNLQTGSSHSGWKDLALDKTGKDNYVLVYWFPSWTGKLFWELYKIYVRNFLPNNLNHPFLFVSLKGTNYGQPYTIGAYRDSHKKAINRINCTYGKDFGTTPHSHRHSYGQNLENAKIEPRIIQKSMHHKSAYSQLVYTLPSVDKINEVLNNASTHVNELNEKKISTNNLLDKLLEHFDRGKYVR